MEVWCCQCGRNSKLGIRRDECEETSVEVWCCRNSELGFRSMDSVDVDTMKPAWRFGAAEIWSLDSEAWIPWTTLDVDATKPAGRFDAAEIRSLDSDAWIPWNVDATKAALRFWFGMRICVEKMHDHTDECVVGMNCEWTCPMVEKSTTIFFADHLEEDISWRRSTRRVQISRFLLISGLSSLGSHKFAMRDSKDRKRKRGIRVQSIWRAISLEVGRPSAIWLVWRKLYMKFKQTTSKKWGGA